MEFIGEFNQTEERLGEAEKSFSGQIQSVRRLKHITFCLLANGLEVFQVVAENKILEETLKIGMAIKGRGSIKSADLKNIWLTNKIEEIEAKEIKILSTPFEEPALDWSKKELNVGGEVFWNYRALSLRHEKEKAIFYIQNTIVETFRSSLKSFGFVEMRTPKLCSQGAEGGANVFSLPYFGKTAYLAQSPQFYKEFGTGIFQKVFEVGPVFRAEKHNTSRHLNEYTSLDLEFGPIESFEEIMSLEVSLMKRIAERVGKLHQRELEILEAPKIPIIEKIPSMPFRVVKKVLAEELGISNTEKDLNPEEEKAIGNYALEKFGSEFLFVTHYPKSARPFYTMPSRNGETCSFDLLFRGQEITTGGQRLHQYEEIIKSIEESGLSIDELRFFTEAHKAGLPPHGGLGLGLERFTAGLLGISSVKHCVLYPRDTTRLSP